MRALSVGLLLVFATVIAASSSYLVYRLLRGPA
jgi:hypothetical protein